MGGRTLQHIAARCGSVNCSWNQIDRPACVEAAKTFGCKKVRKISQCTGTHRMMEEPCPNRHAHLISAPLSLSSH